MIQKNDWVKLQFTPEREKEIEDSEFDLIGNNGQVGQVTHIQPDKRDRTKRLLWIKGDFGECVTWESDVVKTESPDKITVNYGGKKVPPPPVI